VIKNIRYYPIYYIIYDLFFLFLLQLGFGLLQLLDVYFLSTFCNNNNINIQIMPTNKII